MSALRRALRDARSSVDRLRGGGRGWLLVAVALGWMAILGARFVVPALLPRITAEFAISKSEAGFAVTLIWFTYAAMQFPAGALVDRVGERTLLTASVFIGATGLGLFGVAPAFAAFLVACVAFGLGTGFFGPPRATALSRAFADNDGAAFGIVFAGGSVGAAVMPPLASLLASRFGWRLALGALVPAYLLIGIGLWRSVPKREDRGAGRSSSLREEARAVRGAIASRPVAIAVAAGTLMLFAYQGMTAFLPTYLVEAKGLSEATAATLLGVLFAAGAGFQWLAGSAADRYGHGRVLTAVAAVSVVPLVALPFVGGLSALAALAVLLGVRRAIGAVGNAYIVRVLPDEVMGTTWGLLRTGWFAIGATGSMFVGTLADAGWFDESFLALAALTGVAAALYVVLPPRESLE